MAGLRPIPTPRRAPEWDAAEHKSWQHYLGTALRMSTLLNAELLDTHQLSLADVQLLDLLDRCPAGRVAMGELAEALMLLPSRLTRQLKRLEGHGLVQRTVDPQDRRRVVVTVTDAGRTVVQHALITYANTVRTHFLGPLTRPQIAAMAVTCRHISDGLKRPGRLGTIKP